MVCDFNFIFSLSTHSFHLYIQFYIRSYKRIWDFSTSWPDSITTITFFPPHWALILLPSLVAPFFPQICLSLMRLQEDYDCFIHLLSHPTHTHTHMHPLVSHTLQSDKSNDGFDRSAALALQLLQGCKHTRTHTHNLAIHQGCLFICWSHPLHAWLGIFCTNRAATVCVCVCCSVCNHHSTLSSCTTAAWH